MLTIHRSRLDKKPDRHPGLHDLILSDPSLPSLQLLGFSCCRVTSFAAFVLSLLVIFATSLSAQSGGYMTIHRFGNSYAVYDPIKGPDGNFYGADANTQTIYKLTPAGDYTVFYSFAGTSTTGPGSGLLLANDGNFYGVTSGTSEGSIYRLTPDGNFSVIHVFANSDAEGDAPFSNLTQGSDGNFYGTCTGGGSEYSGTIYQVTPAGTLTVLHNFARNEMDLPTHLVQGNDGGLYGQTSYGGSYAAGSIFSLTPAGVFTTVYSFTGTDDGRYPGDLLLGGDGNFYGGTSGGTNNTGTVYSLTSNGVHKTLYTFSNPGGNEIVPVGRLLQADDGNFYGATFGPGIGTIFELTPAGVLTYLYSFPESYTYTGNGSPMGDLLRDAEGNLYGMTGAPDTTLFELAPPPTVNLTAPTPTATVGTGEIGQFELTLSSPFATDLVVSYDIKGSGENGIDYATLKGTAKIKAGKTTKFINIVPPADYSSGRPKVSVKLTLQRDNGYVLGDSVTAKVKLFFPANQ